MFAAATAEIKVSGEYMGYDIDDVVRIAQKFAEDHPDVDG